MKFLEVVGVVFLVAVVIFFIAGPFLPATAEIDRSLKFDDSTDEVKEDILDLYNDYLWPVWRSSTDTGMVFTSTDSGYAWEGNGDNGVCVVDVDENIIKDHIVFRNKTVGNTTWTLTEMAEGTKVDLHFELIAVKNMSARWTGLFIESLMGPNLDRVLGNLK